MDMPWEVAFLMSIQNSLLKPQMAELRGGGWAATRMTRLNFVPFILPTPSQVVWLETMGQFLKPRMAVLRGLNNPQVQQRAYLRS